MLAGAAGSGSVSEYHGRRRFSGDERTGLTIDYGNFKASLRNLQAQYEHRLNLPAEYPDYVREGMTESVIQRFEVCYDSLWKALRRHLIEEIGVPDVPNGPRPVFRAAGQAGLLPAAPDQWETYVEARIDTTHDYSALKVEQAIAVMPDFIRDAAALYTALTGELWE